MKRPRNPLGPYPPGKTRHPRVSKERERMLAELVREGRR